MNFDKKTIYETKVCVVEAQLSSAKKQIFKCQSLMPVYAEDEYIECFGSSDLDNCVMTLIHWSLEKERLENRLETLKVVYEKGLIW